jgi:Platelet-activating factor acetylhydrolase, isoform II
MRPIEILLSLANLLAFFVLVVPLPVGLRWMRHFALVPLPITGAQLLVEGPRWQMVPAYLLSGVFFLVWLLQNFTQAGSGVGEGWTYWLVVALGVLGLAVSIVLPIILPIFRFPPPTGQYEVGTLTYHWVDINRPEVFSEGPNARRELIVQIWYPAKADATGQRAPYMQDTDALAPALARLLHLPEFTFGYMKYFVGYLKYVKTNAILSAPVTDAEPSFPVLIFLEGFTGIRQQDTFQVEELVSHGYIVAAIDQPYAAAAVVFPDGRQVTVDPRMMDLIWQSVSPLEKAPELNGRSFEDGIIPYLAQDAIFTLDQLVAVNQADPNDILTGRMNLQSVGIFGDSLGGIVVGEACRREPRFRACLVEDAPLPADVVRAGLQQPTMWISRDVKTMEREGWSQRDIDGTQNTIMDPEN